MDHNDPKQKIEYLAGYDVAVGIVMSEVLHTLGADKRGDILSKLQAIKPFPNETMWSGFLDARNQMSQPLKN